MVLGAGRGPLVNASLRAAKQADRKLRVYAVEKNPNAVVTYVYTRHTHVYMHVCIYTYLYVYVAVLFIDLCRRISAFLSFFIFVLCSLENWKFEEWGAQVSIVSCDMREWTAPEKADIIVSELLGSFGDNELSPECLDGAQHFLKGMFLKALSFLPHPPNTLYFSLSNTP